MYYNIHKLSRFRGHLLGVQFIYNYISIQPLTKHTIVVYIKDLYRVPRNKFMWLANNTKNDKAT